MFDRKLFREFDRTLLFVTLIMGLAGLLTIYSSTHTRSLSLSESYAFRQANWMLLGLSMMLVMVNISYQRFIDIGYAVYIVNVLLLCGILAVGSVRLGAQRWFSIGTFAFQPSEFIKLSLILALASYIGGRKERMVEIKSLFMPLILFAIPFMLVLVQPDLGTALLLLPILFAMLLAGGARIRYLATMVVMGLISLPLFWHMLRDYQKQRLMVFINPNIDPLGAGYTIIQSKIAIGSGGLFGKGWLSGTQSKLNFLPERHTDFIFSVIGEEWGLLGALALLLLYFILIKRAFIIADLTRDMYGKLIATGITVMLAFQVIINISMTIGLMPVVGIPLPLVSYGGSSLIATLIAVALLLNVGMRRSKF
jgi:rod shape determining protein RodA